MAGRIGTLINRWHLRRAAQHWAAQAEAVSGIELAPLHRLRGEAKAMRRQIDRVLQAAEARLGPVAALPRMALGTDWVWRPDVWRRACREAGVIATGARTAVSDDLALYHDCPLGEIALRQTRNRGEADRAPFGLSLDVFGFQGSFLSLALTLPEPAVSGLTLRHLIEVQVVIESDVSLPAFARLNLQHGPNVAQVVSALPTMASGLTVAAFDLAYAGLGQRPVTKAWLDLIFNDPAMTRVTLRDVVVSRRPRAEL
ncbi:MAG: hypothetical protein B7Z10_06315 [Rhodobacterales bacterium 32-66-7]|nr:MAG: hypothetical protein B7Z31_13810 [Rhodobacterales bacterium 12-65-15]OYX25455.1 MAG: hypothetical protein B7Z10_06315 [Rhodobacterales bacterium 32-66-7]